MNEASPQGGPREWVSESSPDQPGESGLPGAASTNAGSPEASVRPAWARRLVAIAPWAIAGAIISYVFTLVPIGEAWSVARTARLELFLPLMFGAVLGWFLIESSAYAFLFTRFNAPVSNREARSLRGMSYLLTPIHWNVGKAAVILRLRQTKGIPILESTSAVMLYQALDGVVLAALATTGLTLLVGQAEELSRVRFSMTAIVVGILLNILILRANWFRFRWLVWWRGLSIHHAHRRVQLRDLLTILSLKFAYHFGSVLVFYFGTQAFGIELPFALALAATPIILAVGALPITPAGLGTQQAAMLYFFGDRFGGGGTEASILAFGFSFPIALILGRCLIGLFYVRDLSAVRKGSSPPPDAKQAPTPRE
jgi:hypothetical protein